MSLMAQRWLKREIPRRRVSAAAGRRNAFCQNGAERSYCACLDWQQQFLIYQIAKEINLVSKCVVGN